ncbi:MAG: M48 family metalloprotease [Leptolyngbya sp. SIO3F4]|nr:M48 family metalloprotease [Leptolyngbya sp. SIO3F4]
MGLEQSPEYLIKVGLTALKHQDYHQAITTFQELSQRDDISTSYRLKAQMGLIRTYEAQGNLNQAQVLCKPLLESRSQAIRQWAHEKLHQLTKISQISTKPTVNGSAPHNQANEFINNTSGFIPFQSDEGTITQVPKTVTSKTSTTSQIQTQASSQTQKRDSVSTKSLHASQHTEKDEKSTQQQSKPSLFHYQNLNNNLGGEHETANINTSTENNFNQNHDIEHKTAPTENLLAGTPQHSHNKPEKSSTTTITIPQGGPESWPQGSRLRTLKSLGKRNMGQLWFAQLITIYISFLVIRWLVKIAVSLTRDYLIFFNRLLPINFQLSTFFWETQTWTVIIGLSVLTFASPWLWPLLLRPSTRLTQQQLKSYSLEANQLLNRFCSKRRWPVPKIQLIHSKLPLIFSYGWQPRYGQLVISQGLLDSLTADELAAVIVYEMSNWSTLAWLFFSIYGLLLQGFHRTYWLLARWGESRSILLKIAAGALANLSYVIFWLLSQVGCGLARIRTPYSDRNATELTGNPNGLIRALAKISTTMTCAIEQQGYTPPLLESLILMLPVGPSSKRPSLQYFAWDAFNPLRHWLSLNQAHPPLGDRLYTLNAYGKHWQLKPSINFARLQLKHVSRTPTLNDWKNLLLQGGIWSGLIIGLGLATLMWLIGAISTLYDVSLLAWLYKDHSIFLSMPLISAATGHLLRISYFFPKISESITTNRTQFTSWQKDPAIIPLDSLPIKIDGTLTGRPPLANWLGQEWRLGTNYGSIKLHYLSYLGPLNNIWGLTNLLDTPLQVTGWFRRGHNIWIDIDHLKTHQNQTKTAQHPLWANLISFFPLFYGLWLIFNIA